MEVKDIKNLRLNVRCPHCNEYFDVDRNTLEWIITNAIEQLTNKQEKVKE